MRAQRILVVDDEPRMRRVLEIMLQKMGHDVCVASDGQEAVALFQTNAIDLVITDLRMPHMDGLELLSTLRQQTSELPVIVITAHGTIETAVAAMKLGAIDYIVRPFDIETVETAVSRVLKGKETERQNEFLREERDRGWDAFVGTSQPMLDVYAMIQQVGPSKASVLITGETGTGKELAARAVHNASPRRDRLFVPVNCAAIPADMLESELFGFEKGAFTGAIKDRIGKFELADGGTIFLDELTEMPMALQTKLLRTLQENTVERLGGNRAIKLDIRVVAATNRDPRQAIVRGLLREDLYYRINVITIHLPPLRDRIEDLDGLVQHFVTKHCPKLSTRRPTESAMQALSAYPWPGNVRELENMVERALILGGGAPLDAQHFHLEAATTPGSGSASPHGDAPITLGPLASAVDQLEAKLIAQALQSSAGNKAKAANLLDISERTLWYKIKKLSISMDPE